MPRRKDVDSLEAIFRRVYETIMAQAVEELTPTTITMPVPPRMVQQVVDQLAGDELMRLFARGYDDAASGVSDKPSFFDVRDDAAVRFLEAYKVRLSSSITETVNRKLTTALAEGIAGGETMDQLRDRVRAVIPETVENGAERVARTEAARAQGEGRVAGWTLAGIERKEWLLSPNPCDLCMAIWQKGPIPVHEPFFKLGETLAGTTNDYMDVMAPPAHPNDRCAVTAVIEDDDSPQEVS